MKLLITQLTRLMDLSPCSSRHSWSVAGSRVFPSREQHLDRLFGVVVGKEEGLFQGSMHGWMDGLLD